MPHTLINLPDAERFVALARGIFASGTLTNNGATVRELEARLKEYLQSEYLVLTSSGTLALQIAYRALGLTGEVITTPFSWVTTVSSLHWLGLRPRFVDIYAGSFNMNPEQIEAALSPRTSAVLAVHSFGNPCDIEAIEDIAARRGLLTVYDAAHAFGARYKGKSVLSFGNASILSLHATKIFHAVEGGVVILRDKVCYQRALLAANNGLDAAGNVAGPGINGRMSELHAAAGLCLLGEIDTVLSRRRAIAEELRIQLRRSSAVGLQWLNPDAEVNHAYFPIVLPTRELLERTKLALNAEGLRPRHYCELPLNRLPYLDAAPPMPVAENLSSRLLCLPFRADATLQEMQAIGRIVATVCPLTERLTARAYGS